VCFKKKKSDTKMAFIDIFQTQVIVTTKRKRERDSSIIFRVRTERKNMSGSKGLIDSTLSLGKKFSTEEQKANKNEKKSII
jgi:hypothetical protein